MAQSESNFRKSRLSIFGIMSRVPCGRTGYPHLANSQPRAAIPHARWVRDEAKEVLYAYWLFP